MTTAKASAALSPASRAGIRERRVRSWEEKDFRPTPVAAAGSSDPSHISSARPVIESPPRKGAELTHLVMVQLLQMVVWWGQQSAIPLRLDDRWLNIVAHERWA